MGVAEFLRSHAMALPVLAKFACGMAIIVGIPQLCRRIRLPPAVGLLASGIAIGPHGLDMFGQHRPIADFFAELGKLLLMFTTGLEIDIALFRKAQARSVIFGVLTTAIPLLLGTAAGLWFGYQLLPSLVIGSLLASHTLLGLPIAVQFNATRLEPVTVTVGATIVSDTLSLVVFAVCVSTFQSGFSAETLGIQIIEIVLFVPLILFGLSRLGAFILKRMEDDENAHFILMLGMLAVAGVLAQAINLPGIVGAFLAGLAVNAAVQGKPAKEKLQFFGNSLFVPVFFIVTGFLIDPSVFASSIASDLALVAAIIAALMVGKWLAAEIAGRAFHYGAAARRTIWSLTLPQVAATLAATLVGFDTFNAQGQRLLDRHILDAAFMLLVTTAILGPILTERYVPRMVSDLAERSEAPLPAERMPVKDSSP
jgi:Kef-type K+ transport system membrane component KefB